MVNDQFEINVLLLREGGYDVKLVNSSDFINTEDWASGRSSMVCFT